MDSGLAAEPVPGQRKALIRVRRSGMTVTLFPKLSIL